VNLRRCRSNLDVNQKQQQGPAKMTVDSHEQPMTSELSAN
jgi:hypothetical protein